MRRELTYPETILWARLKGRKLGWQFRRQLPIGPYIADFACTQANLLIEADGETHTSDDALEYDRRRTEFLAQEGWTILRFWNREIIDNTEGVLDVIREALYVAQHTR